MSIWLVSASLKTGKPQRCRFILEQREAAKASFHPVPILKLNNSVSSASSFVHFIDNESVNNLIRNPTKEKVDRYETSLSRSCAPCVFTRGKCSCISSPPDSARSHSTTRTILHASHIGRWRSTTTAVAAESNARWRSASAAMAAEGSANRRNATSSLA